MINSDLRARCEAIARLEIQRKELADEVKRLKEKAKSDGFDAALITKTVAVMLKPAARQKQVLEQHSLFDNYLMAVGLLPDDVAATDHDPETGEITETPSAVLVPLVTAAAAGEGASVDAAAPAAPIQEREAGSLTVGAGEHPTDETGDAVPASLDHTPVKSPDLTETPPTFDPVPLSAAGQVADADLCRAASATDQSTDLEIPAFLRRTQPDARAA